MRPPRFTPRTPNRPSLTAARAAFAAFRPLDSDVKMPAKVKGTKRADDDLQGLGGTDGVQDE